MRPQTTLAVLAMAAAVFAPALAAQAVRLPDSLKYTALPSDPADFPAKVKAGAYVYSLYSAGCPSDGGYPGAAHAALVEAAETDLEVRVAVAQDHGLKLKAGRSCPDDLPRFEALLAKWLRAEWEAGLLGPDRIFEQETLGGYGILGAIGELAYGSDPATYQLLRGIARDPDVYVEPGIFFDGFSMDLRRDAAHAMFDYRMNQGMGEAEAVKAVEGDLAGAPPIRGHWRPPGFEPPGS